jgi:alkylation response protein AidB-like acyl-CoA dehydrogenase
MAGLMTDELELLRSSVRAFLQQHSTESDIRRLMETTQGYDPAVWKAMATQLGLQGLAIPEEAGGSGASLVELCVVFEEMGRVLLSAPFLGTVGLGAMALTHCCHPMIQQEFLPNIATGQTIATLAVVEGTGDWDLAQVRTQARHADGKWLLSGTKDFVLDGHIADLILVVAKAGENCALFAVKGDAAGLSREALPTLDQTRRQSVLRFEDTPARLLEREFSEGELRTVLTIAAVALAAEQVGGAQRALEISVEYAKKRTQFGKPIGAMQAIKHHCANMLLEIELARAAVRLAAESATAAPGNFEMAAVRAAVQAAEAYQFATGQMIQIHGGTGFTWEHPAHLYLKRATASTVLFGNVDFHRERYAGLIGL